MRHCPEVQVNTHLKTVPRSFNMTLTVENMQLHMTQFILSAIDYYLEEVTQSEYHVSDN